MARVESPLFSLDARGDVGGALRYQKRKGTNYVKKLNNLPSSESVAQKNWRYQFWLLCDIWSNYSPEEKAYYDEVARVRGFTSGRRYFLHRGLTE